MTSETQKLRILDSHHCPTNMVLGFGQVTSDNIAKQERNQDQCVTTIHWGCHTQPVTERNHPGLPLTGASALFIQYTTMTFFLRRK